MVTTGMIWKNICFLCLAFLLSFTAFQSIQNLESSISEEANLGTASLSTMYGVFIISCNFAPLVIHRLGTRRTMQLGLVGNVIFTTIHFHSHHYTLIPSAILLGAVAGPMWAAQVTHLIKCAAKYSEMTREKDYIVFSQFTGYFYMTYGFTQIFGNIVSAAVLKDNRVPVNDDILNSSVELDLAIVTIQRICGAADDGGTEIDVNKLPTHESQTLLFTIYTIIGLMAVLALIPLDQLDRICGPRVTNISGGCLCAATLQMLKDPKVLLMVPFLMYCGMEQAFLFGDFTKSYISCAIGVDAVGAIMICYGLSNSISSVIAGRASKYTGQSSLLLLALIINMALMTVLLSWKPTSDDQSVFYVITGGWGIADAIWQTQLSTVIGGIFRNKIEATFSLGKMLQALGYMISFAFNGLIPVYAKIIVVGTILIIAFICYIIMQRKVRGKNFFQCGKLDQGYSITEV